MMTTSWQCQSAQPSCWSSSVPTLDAGTLLASLEQLGADELQDFLAVLKARKQPAILIEEIRAMSWRQFERLMAETYVREGWTAELTKGGGDGGVDLFLSKQDQRWLVQCKHWRANVGVKVVREMYGLLHHHRADRVVIVALNGFTPEALEFVQDKPGIHLLGAGDVVGLIGQGLGTQVVPLPTRGKKADPKDTVAAWVDDTQPRPDPMAVTSKQDIYAHYLSFVAVNGSKSESSPAFWQRLSRLLDGFETKGRQITVNGRRDRFVPLLVPGL